MRYCMDNIICKICNKSFESFKSLHSHLRVHGVQVANYYEVHYPKVDLYDKKQLKFEDVESYFSFDFNSRRNFTRWLSEAPKGDAQAYFTKTLKARKDKKEIKYSPCQVELRSCGQTASILSFMRIFDALRYYEYCEELGFISRLEDVYNLPYYELPTLKVQIDTREQLPLEFQKEEKIIEKLDYGDYKLFNENGYAVYFERKSLADFVSTLSGGLDRFKNEIKRAQDAGSYLVILVEASLSECIDFKSINSVFNKMKSTPEYIFHNVREVIQEFDNIQFLFVDKRQEMERVMKRLYYSAGKYKKADLQLLYDLKRI